MNRYIDVCVNLLNKQFEADRQAVIKRAQAAGVDTFVITGTDITSSKAAIDLHVPGKIYSTAGVHPHDSGSLEPTWRAELGAMLGSSSVVAVGETGLDFNRNFAPQDRQIDCFRTQINLAVEHRKPLFVHDRESNGMVLELLQEHSTILPNVVIHCFTGTEVELTRYIEAGFYIGITGWVTERKRGAGLRELMHLIPQDRLLIETDAPFLKPQNLPSGVDGGHPKRRNEPAFLPWVANQIAACRGEDPDYLAAYTRKNALDFFNIADT